MSWMKKFEKLWPKLKKCLMLVVVLISLVLMHTLTGCSAQTVSRNPALTKDCTKVALTKEHTTPRKRDEVNILRGKSIAECTARMRKLR